MRRSRKAGFPNKPGMTCSLVLNHAIPNSTCCVVIGDFMDIELIGLVFFIPALLFLTGAWQSIKPPKRGKTIINVLKVSRLVEKNQETWDFFNSFAPHLMMKLNAVIILITWLVILIVNDLTMTAIGLLMGGQFAVFFIIYYIKVEFTLIDHFDIDGNRSELEDMEENL